MTDNVLQLRPDPSVSSWGKRRGLNNGLYYAEAHLAEQALGLWVERVRRGWRFQVLEVSTDKPVAEGRVRFLRDAKSVLHATATRLMDPRRLV
jgi:hypothetical protein